MNLAKNSKQMFSIFLDFILLIFIFGTFLTSFYFGRKILFYTFSDGGELIFLTESMPGEFEKLLLEGDAIYDTITKKKIGIVLSRVALLEGDSVRFVITTNADYIPKSSSLRTAKLWFTYEIKEQGYED